MRKLLKRVLKTETWIDSERLCEVLYVFEMPTGEESAGQDG